MKKRLVVVVALIALVVVGGAMGWTRVGNSSGGESGGRELVVDQSQSGKQIEAKQGDVIKIRLDSNVTTGFQWQLSANSNEAVVSLADHAYVAPHGQGEPVTGAGGSEEWRFKATGAGTSDLRLEYSQPWEGGTKADSVFALTVVVR